MFQKVAPESNFSSAISISVLIYHSAVRNIRKMHGNALFSILVNLFQAVLFVAAFFVMFIVLGMRSAALRGDFLLYIMSGIFMFMTHVKAVDAVYKSEGPSSPMMKHAPMNTIISIVSSAISSLYIQVLTLSIILFVYHAAWNPIEIDKPIGALGMLLLAWFSGVSVGMILLAIRPWFPGLTEALSLIWRRANMIASGKMFVANTLPGFMVAMFDWNPLFHIIDQARGFVFINYNPHNSNTSYPLYLSLAILMLGLMGEFYTRRRASASWSARR
nr:ABC transporter permease [uncultured Shimia sp.]